MEEKKFTEESQITEKSMTRRDFVIGAGKAVAGVAVTGSALTLLSACAPAATATKAELAYTFKEPSKDAAVHPFPYQKLDPDAVQKRAYEAYKQKGG